MGGNNSKTLYEVESKHAHFRVYVIENNVYLEISTSSASSTTASPTTASPTTASPTTASPTTTTFHMYPNSLNWLLSNLKELSTSPIAVSRGYICKNECLWLTINTAGASIKSHTMEDLDFDLPLYLGMNPAVDRDLLYPKIDHNSRVNSSIFSLFECCNIPK